MRRIVIPQDAAEAQSIGGAVMMLRALGVLTGPGECDHAKFDTLRAAVKQHFAVPWTSITAPMERLLYAINAVQQPRNVVGIGIFCGNTLIWNIGAAVGPGKCYDAERIVGCDTDAEAMSTAAANLEKVGARDGVELLIQDGHEVLDAADYPIDVLYLDANGPLPGTTEPNTKLIYLSLLKRAYDKVPHGGLVIAHDTLPEWFVRSAGEYLEFVRDPEHFRMSVSVEPDREGLELSVK